jgi:YggT family protein
MLFQMVSLVFDVVAGLVAGTCLLRFLMQWQRISFHQPLGQFVFAVTDWLVLPLRRVIPPWSAWDLSSLVGAFLIKLVQYTAVVAGRGRAGGIGLVAAC